MRLGDETEEALEKISFNNLSTALGSQRRRRVWSHEVSSRNGHRRSERGLCENDKRERGQAVDVEWVARWRYLGGLRTATCGQRDLACGGLCQAAKKRTGVERG
jgi:hypothetical protein